MTRKQFTFWLCVLLVIWSLGGTAQSKDIPACRVQVPDASGPGTSYGSGVLIGTDERHSYVLTNNHVVKDGSGRANVIFWHAAPVPGKVLARDARWDVAIVEIAPVQSEPVSVNEAPLNPGDPAIGGGFGPDGNWATISGRVKKFYAPSVGDREYSMFSFSGGQSRQGDSGGPICNDSGELIGLIWGGASGESHGTPVTKAVDLCNACGVCVGGRCQVQPPARRIVQQPAKPAPKVTPVIPVVPVTPVGCNCSGELARLKGELAELTARLESVSKVRGPAGKDGRDGKDGKDCDPAAFVQKPFTVEIYSPSGKLLQSKVVQPGGKLPLQLYITKPTK